jgi:hypothetical protein
MWLVNATTLKLEEFVDSEVPRYAILSHTWGKQEVSFQDMQGERPCAAEKEGYAKITNSCAQAARDGLQYIWIDTCCIDKKSSAELSEAINSMFRWYKKAEVCYAFLADVSSWEDVELAPFAEASWCIESEFAKSRWFTRGWTLQELIAPANLEFYSGNWEKIGTKAKLQLPVAEVTGIDVAALQGRDIETFSVAQRMSWASRRNTRRVEDEAYCLMGIFGIHMPMLYGEGKRAFLRLQEEILRTSDDHSLFAWVGNPPYPDHGWRNLLANSPSEFKDAGSVTEFKHFKTKPYSMTNQGLGIVLPFVRHKPNQIIAILNCQHRSSPRKPLGIYLENLSNIRDGPYARMVKNEICVVGDKRQREVELKTLVIPESPQRWHEKWYGKKDAYVAWDERPESDSDSMSELLME